jgi:8-oxo-dGTP diphosphatase
MRDRTLCFLVKGNPPNEVLPGFKKNGFGAGKYTGIGGKVEADETITRAAVRELEEETGVRAMEHNLKRAGHLLFVFPSNPAWSQSVHVFMVTEWQGDLVESFEMEPRWFGVNELPYEQMWQDAPYWLPKILRGERVQMQFVFEADNEAVSEVRNEGFPTSG